MLQSSRKQILIVDDDAAIREGLAKLIPMNPEYVVAGEAANAFDALMMVQDHAADLALVDLYLPGFHGLALVEQLRFLQPKLKIIVYTAHDDEYFALSALRAGAQGFVSKSEPAENVVTAVNTVFSGQLYLEPKLRERLLALVENTPEIEVRDLLANS